MRGERVIRPLVGSTERSKGEHTSAAKAPRADGAERLCLLVLAAGAAAALSLAAWLVPDARGLGTHEQLGLPPCGLRALTGLPCPSCGMTTAFALGMRGQLLEAFLAQPAGALIFLALLPSGLACLGAALLGYPLLSWASRRLPWPRIGLLLLLALALNWGWLIWQHA